MSCSWLVVTAAILPTCRLCPKARVLRVTCSVAVATAAPMTSLPHCVVSVLRWCSWDGHKRTPSCSGNRIRRHDSSHSDCFTTPTSSELKWLFQINYADIQRIACRDRGAQRSLLDEVTLLVIPVTHVPEIGAENPNQKTGTVNWHENKECLNCPAFTSCFYQHVNCFVYGWMGGSPKSCSLPETDTRKIRYQTACQALQKPIPFLWYQFFFWRRFLVG